MPSSKRVSPPPIRSPRGCGVVGRWDANTLREDAEHPVADLTSVQFQNNLNIGFGPNSAAQNDLNFQPVIPIHLNDDWNIIARPITPVLYQPRLAPDLGPEFGLGNIEPEIFLSPAHPGRANTRRMMAWGRFDPFATSSGITSICAIRDVRCPAQVATQRAVAIRSFERLEENAEGIPEEKSSSRT